MTREELVEYAEVILEERNLLQVQVVMLRIALKSVRLNGNYCVGAEIDQHDRTIDTALAATTEVDDWKDLPADAVEQLEAKLIEISGGK